ncbi:MAG: winged helix DNA-binding domain-containing protein [Acidobacteriota bacterium]
MLTPSNIAYYRLYNQYIARTTFEQPSDIVKWLGAVQAQDYLGALWAIGLRTRNTTEEDIEQAIANKTIIRTWPMRGTLNFVAATDACWMLKLLTPRVVAGNARRLLQEFNLDEAVFARSKESFLKALQGGKQLSRDAMYQVLEAARIDTANQRGLHILSQLAQEGVICFGAREGKQQTFVLLDEWVPKAKTMERNEALAELAKRYFTSHGPATLQDFAWWSGLTTADARAGVEMVNSELTHEVVDGQKYWLPQNLSITKDPSPTAYLLPPYDEYTVAYKDRSAVLDPFYAKQAGNGIFSPVIIIDGQVVGTWKRTFKKGSVVVTPSPFTSLKRTEKQALVLAANHYGSFLKMPVVLAS